MILAGGISEAGLVRTTNEDRFVIDERMNLFAVADGMGGHRAGEVASRLAIEALVAFIRGSGPGAAASWPYGLDPALSQGGNRLRTAIHLANRSIVQAAGRADKYSGMGTTIVSLLVDGTRAVVGSVGDSRLYLLSNGDFSQVTQDDSWVATVLAHDPTIDPAQLAHHPMRNVLTSVLGPRESVEVHLLERPIARGDVFLLCTDGLHGVLDDAVMRDVLVKVSDVTEAARRLVDAALERRSRDNITAVVVRYDLG